MAKPKSLAANKKGNSRMIRRSKYFIATLKSDNLNDGDILNEMRLIVRIFNMTENTNYRLMRVGRLGDKSEFASLYKGKVGGRTYSKIRVSEASRFDIYLNNRETFFMSYNPELTNKLTNMLRNWAIVR